MHQFGEEELSGSPRIVLHGVESRFPKGMPSPHLVFQFGWIQGQRDAADLQIQRFELRFEHLEHRGAMPGGRQPQDHGGFGILGRQAPDGRQDLEFRGTADAGMLKHRFSAFGGRRSKDVAHQPIAVDEVIAQEDGIGVVASQVLQTGVAAGGVKCGEDNEVHASQLI